MTKHIKVLGTGCSACKSLTDVVDTVVTTHHIDATIEKIEDIEEIMSYNVMTTPVLIVDDVITSKGRIPSHQEILAMLS